MVPLILQLDKAGQATGWLNWRDAVTLYAKDQVSWTIGDNVFRFHGGTNRLLNRQSYIDVHSIIATRGIVKSNKYNATPPLTNRALFRRDENLCMYCLTSLPDRDLTRDHIVPLGLGGKDCWTNVVTSCARCNQHKACRTPQQAGMKLHAIPYAPNYAEWLVLRNRRILSDQMAFLKTQFSKRHQH